MYGWACACCVSHVMRGYSGSFAINTCVTVRVAFLMSSSMRFSHQSRMVVDRVRFCTPTSLMRPMHTCIMLRAHRGLRNLERGGGRLRDVARVEAAGKPGAVEEHRRGGELINRVERLDRLVGEGLHLALVGRGEGVGAALPTFSDRSRGGMQMRFLQSVAWAVAALKP